MSAQWVVGAARWVKFVVPPISALLIGVGIGIASSPASLTRDHRAIKPTLVAQPSPSAVRASPLPTVTEPGVLGIAPHLLAVGTSDIMGTAANLAAGSVDGGNTWAELTPPPNGAGIAEDPSNPLHAISGGPKIQATSDGGKTWQPARKAPPGAGPYQVLGISQFDPQVWFFVHEGKLLRTRDATLSWRELALPALSNPVLIPGHVFGEFFLASGGRVFELIDNGEQVVEQPPLPSGVTVANIAAVGGDQLTLLARGGNNGLYLLRGSTWSALGGVTGAPIAAGANVILVGNGGAKLAPGAVSYSVDGGAAWRQAVGLPPDQSVEAIAGQPSSITFFAYCYGGDIYTSSDGGRSWTVLTRALRSRTG